MRPGGGAMKKFGGKRRMSHFNIFLFLRNLWNEKVGNEKEKALHPGEMQKLKMKSEIEVISKTRNKVGVQELKEDGAKFRVCKIYSTFQLVHLDTLEMLKSISQQKLISKLGRFGAQFFAPVTNEPSDIPSDDDDDDGEEVESEHSEDEE
ncbi:unnamed protein product [Wuchereria bancrofti]|uniref:Uncharacterized protein n=2 Tax=Wuchereria bancrofti TaxID=6293 RepID=A0A3P7EDZ5_WUCBA|nr:unnamed protein product [Wuchereria bancrofti]